MKDWIVIKVDDTVKCVDRDGFIRKSVAMLREFGYSKLSLEAVEKAVSWLECNQGTGSDAIQIMLREYVVFPQIEP